MKINLPVSLVTESDALEREVQGTVYLEDWLPRWTTYLDSLTGGKIEQYALGHCACVSEAGGLHTVHRFRSGSFANPQDEALYHAHISPAQIADFDPAEWDAAWSVAPAPLDSFAMYPAWTADSNKAHGANMTCLWDSAGSGNLFLFYWSQQGINDFFIRWELTTTGASVDITGSSNLASPDSLANMQLAAVRPDEVFITRLVEVEPSRAAWHKKIMGTSIHRYTYSGGSWTLDNSFDIQQHTHIYAGLIKDNQHFDSPTTQVLNQWGKRISGGLAANAIDENRVLISFGATFYHRYGKDTHSQAIYSYIYHRDSGIWELVTETGTADYKFDDGLQLDVGAKASVVFRTQAEHEAYNQTNLVVWNRLAEPINVAQVDANLGIPRLREVVYARIRNDGRQLTIPQYLGHQDYFTGASIVLAKGSTTTPATLFALGWRAIAVAPAANYLIEPDRELDGEEVDLVVPTDINLGPNYEEAEFINEYEVTQSNRMNTRASFNVPSAASLFAAGTKAQAGALARVFLGNVSDQVQITQGYIDAVTPRISSDSEFNHQAQVTARADKLLQDTRAETVIDLLPQHTQESVPFYPIQDFARHKGRWDYKRVNWPDLFFSGQYPELVDRGVYRLSSSPEAVTGGELADPGDPTSGGGGKIWDARPDYIGTWWNDISWLTMPTMVDGAIQACVRFGDDKDHPDFDFVATTTHRVYATATRSNGLITKIDWHTGGYGGPIWNTVAQEATMAGLICHAVDIGKKYAFVWEANSNFVVSSHTDDTWKKEDFDSVDFDGLTVGSNRLYLIMSDFDEDDPDWRANAKWINLAVAGGVNASTLTPGKPAELKMVVSAGTIYCFYRNYVSGSVKETWRFALSYKAGRFGAGKFGLIGRGHSGIQWDYLYPGRHHITKMDNVVDFWNVYATDGVIDKTMEDNLRYITWLGRQVTEFKRKVDLADVSPVSVVTFLDDDLYGGRLWIQNPVIDFEIEASASGTGLYGFVLRADNDVTPFSNNCILLTIQLGASNTLTPGLSVSAKVAFNRYIGGTNDLTDYAPVHLDRAIRDNRLPVRITALGYRYTVWIAGKYVGHFLDETEFSGGYLAYYGNIISGTTWPSIQVQELYEVPEYAIVDINQPIVQAMQRLIGKRRIKGFFRAYSEQLLISYFLVPDIGPTLEDTLMQSNYQYNDRFASVVTVQGACAEATYAHSDLLKLGRHYVSTGVPDIIEVEHCWLEARAILKEIYEQQRTTDLVGLLDFRIEPEDKIHVIVAFQLIDEDFIVDDVIIHFAKGNPQGQGVTLNFGLGTRRFIDTVEGL